MPNGTMLILRGIAGTFGGSNYPRGALDEHSALEYARRVGYVGEVLDVAGATGTGSAQVAMALARIRRDPSVTALYGFSGGGYNIRHVINTLRPEQRTLIKRLVVIGAPKNPPSLYRGPWELVYRGDPPEGHMAGPKVLLESLGADSTTRESSMAAQMLDISAEMWRKIFPRAPQKYIDGLVVGKVALDRAGITLTRTRTAFCLANVEHESCGLTIKDLTENINYTPERMAVVFRARVGSAANVRNRFGTGINWQKKAFDVLYGNRMGNRPGTDDGSKFIGRGAPQITGRDGYREVGKRAGLALEAQPELASEPNNQGPIIAGFWTWKNLNAVADAGDWKRVVKLWNGGTNGMADREAQLAGNDPIIKKLAFVNAVMPALMNLPGGPVVPHQPPKDVVAEATKKERATRNGGAVAATTGGAGEAVNAGTQQPDKPAPFITPMVTYTLIVVGLVALFVGALLLARKVKAVRDNWV